MTTPGSSEVFLICDLNVFVLAYLFDSKIMLEGPSYSFGKLYVHKTVFDELLKWETSTAKKSKFGIELIRSMIEKCSDLMIENPVLADAEREKFFRRIGKVEQQLQPDQKSSDTSDPDKMYLAVTLKLNANLATQERTLRSISKKVIGENRLFSFDEMIIDRCKNNLFDKSKVQDGLSNLSHFDENFIKGNKAKILEEIKKL